MFGEHRDFSSTEINVAVAIFAVGGMLGALVGGAFANVSYLGRLGNAIVHTLITS